MELFTSVNIATTVALPPTGPSEWSSDVRARYGLADRGGVVRLLPNLAVPVPRGTALLVLGPSP